MRDLRQILILALMLSAFSLSTPAVADQIVIGFSGPLSGVAAEYGQDVVNGLDLAVRELNAGGGITVGGKPYTFKLERLDDRADATQAVNNARRFKSNGAIAVFNAVFGTSAAMMRINEEKDHEFLVLSFTSTPRITDMGNKLTVVVPGPFSSMAHISAEWAISRGWNKCAMVVTVGPYGDEWRKVFKEIWEKRGGSITADRPANYYSETDFSSVLATALASRPDVMLIGGPSSTTALVIEQARGMGFKGGFIMIDQAKLDYIKDVLKGTEVMGNLIGSAGAGIPPREGQNFTQRYRAAFSRAATAESSFNFTFMHALARAISAAGTVADVYKIRAAFAQAFPMYATEFPMEAHGITAQGRVLVVTATQTISEGKQDLPEIYFWWPKTLEEFERIEKASQIDQNIPRRWIKTD